MLNSHCPVLLQELTEALKPRPGSTIVDCTVGAGGHARAILKLMPGGCLIGLDRDASALEKAREALSDFPKGAVILKKADFAHTDDILSELGITEIDGAVFDLGLSSLQLNDAQRGFSFQKDGPLDMRMDQTQAFSAYDVVNRTGEKEIAELIRRYGEEPRARKIARFIISERKTARITRTFELADIVRRAYGRAPRRKSHPATRTFQAIRIVVNDEISLLEKGLEKIFSFLKPGARVSVISFHSLEDRVVKNIFREKAKAGIVKIVTKKPITPKESEIAANPRCRSSKLRIAERL